MLEYQVITSEQNPIIKHIKGLKLKKNRIKYNSYLVEGVRIIDEAIRHQAQMERVVFCSSLVNVEGGRKLLMQAQKKYTVNEITPELMKKLSDTENPQGIIAVAQNQNNSLEAININHQATIVILDRIQDPGNLGTIIRTAEAAGTDGIILTKGSVDPYNSKTIRGTMGALFHIPVIICNDNDEWIEFIKKYKFKLFASHLETNQSYDDIEYPEKTAIIIGNEANGIDEKLLKIADEAIKIPIYGKIESLNASVAAGLLMYKAVEKRKSIND
ncbi:RNA methyltransferase, TrmH family [Alkaliphilus peptidifermentans DSM 18978]|uniref:RNA methyltransferase, TrmH family n=1 Tax=Alkaliphilus peptidifermentans DSM 18978 TaxID=1120976 RepID=A0A1G5IW02_9FIRM|nr:RNA methyltransferase, TrmH family [Alkaliphilus peptidifermentans DSM 18978]